MTQQAEIKACLNLIEELLGVVSRIAPEEFQAIADRAGKEAQDAPVYLGASNTRASTAKIMLAAIEAARLS